MVEDKKIIELFFARSETAIRELDNKYGKICKKLSQNIVNNRQDAEECVNDAYLGVWNSIPPETPDPLLAYVCKIVRNISLKTYYRKEAAKRSSNHTVSMNEIDSCFPGEIWLKLK
jgi:RNA polymerase sigma-70 factor (ECF subfamily)